MTVFVIHHVSVTFSLPGLNAICMCGLDLDVYTKLSLTRLNLCVSDSLMSSIILLLCIASIVLL